MVVVVVVWGSGIIIAVDCVAALRSSNGATQQKMDRSRVQARTVYRVIVLLLQVLALVLQRRQQFSPLASLLLNDDGGQPMRVTHCSKCRQR